MPLARQSWEQIPGLNPEFGGQFMDPQLLDGITPHWLVLLSRPRGGLHERLPYSLGLGWFEG